MDYRHEPGYLHGVDLSVMAASMWVSAGADKYHLAHPRKDRVYIANLNINDSKWGLFSGRKLPAGAGDVMCDYHGVMYKYNALTAKKKPL